MDTSQNPFRHTDKTINPVRIGDPSEVMDPRHSKDANSKIQPGPHAMLTVLINGAVREFPITWLRENCRCPDCFFKEGHQRLLDPDTPVIETASIHSHQVDDSTLSIRWVDGHFTEYKIDWLKINGTFKSDEIEDDFYFNKPWKSDTLGRIPTFDFSDVISGNETNHNSAMARLGVFLITGAPTCENTVTEFAEKISFSGLRSTNFGKIFDLRIHDHENMKLAFTNKRISLHNDLLIRRQPPTVTLLHCLKRSGLGGESLITDGFAVALHLKDKHPEMYQILTEAEVEVEDINNNWHYISRAPVITEQNGRIKSIQFNNWERSPNIRLEASRYNDYRTAYKKFSEYAHSPEFCVKHALNPGEIIAVDNTRLLHGREAFDERGGFSRHLQGCHIDVDDLISMHRKQAASHLRDLS